MTAEYPMVDLSYNLYAQVVSNLLPLQRCGQQLETYEDSAPEG